MQTIENHTAEILKDRNTGERFVRLDRRTIIPFGMCALGAGKDAWLRKITANCPDCGERHPVTDLTESGYCWECVEAEIQDENAV
jgi:hypothetical protein